MTSFSLKKARQTLSYGTRLRPTRDWLILLVIFIILLLASVGWNLWQFSRVASGQKIGNVTITAPVEINLSTVQALFIQRAQQRKNYESQYRFVDPSL